MNEYLYTLTLGFMAGLLVFTEIRNYIERKQLLNRLMSRDYSEYAHEELRVKKATIPDKIQEGIEI